MKRTVVLAAFTLIGIPAFADAHGGNNDPNVVHACIGNVSKVVRVVAVSGTCITAPPLVAETPTHWAIQGPQGVPGADGQDGQDGQNGQDATPAAGPCFDNINRYVDCGNGTVTDTVTGLIWLKQWNCLPDIDWAAANQAALGLKNGDCGLADNSSPGDWRLPTKEEWSATIARAAALGCQVITIPSAPPSLTNDAGTACLSVGPSSFPGVPADFLGSYWSSTSNETVPSNAVTATLTSGGVSSNTNKIQSRRLWPVRGGSH